MHNEEFNAVIESRSRSFGRVASSAVIIVLFTILALAASRAILLTWSDFVYQRGTPSAVARARQIMPSNPRYYYTSALLEEQNAPLSPSIERDFASAVHRNPRFTDAILAWAIEKEIRGDKAGAEALLLQARANDHTLRPAWALANYYYRKGDAEHFWPEAHESLRILGKTGLSEGRFDPVPVYQLCWKMDAPPDVILARAIPDDRVIRDHYLSFLLETNRLDAAIPVAGVILRGVQPFELVFLFPYINALIAHDRLADAWGTWNTLYDRKLLPYPGPDPAKNSFLTNGELLGVPSGQGFDWRAQYADPVRFLYSGTDHVYRFDIAGGIPEQAPFLAEIVPLIGGKSYRFTARYHSDFDAEKSGLTWAFVDRKSGQKIAGRPTSETKADETTLTVEFDAPASTQSIDLRLAYQRQFGTASIEGFYELRHADLTLR